MKGFTLIETLVAIVIFTIMMGGLFALVVTSYENYNYLWEQVLAVHHARRGVRTMIKEIREATMGEDGSYPISYAGDKEFIFFSDIDKDDEVERVRYYLGGSGSGSRQEQCVTYSDGGSCSVSFTDFLSGELSSAQLTVSVEGDFGWGIEYADIYVDGNRVGRACQTECSDCAGIWQGHSTFEVTEWAEDGVLQLTADANGFVNDFCDWEETNHAMKARFELVWSEEVSGDEGEFRKGVTQPTGTPVEYHTSGEEVEILSYYVRNTPPIFEYFDAEGNKLEDYPVRLKDTRIMKVFLRVDVDPDRDPQAFDLESRACLRNLRWEYEEL